MWMRFEIPSLSSTGALFPNEVARGAGHADAGGSAVGFGSSRAADAPPVRQRMRRVAVVVLLGLAVAVALFTLVLDQWGGATQLPGFDAVGVGVMAAIGVSLFLVTRSRAAALVPGGGVALLLFLRLVDLSPVKPALRAVRQIHAGMTEADVRSVLEQQFPAGSRFRRALWVGPMRPDGFSIVLDPHDSRYDAAVIQIGFEAERCTGARFLAD